jgi:hypothetical protein
LRAPALDPLPVGGSSGAMHPGAQRDDAFLSIAAVRDSRGAFVHTHATVIDITDCR